MKKLILVITIFLSVATAFPQGKRIGNEAEVQKKERMGWWVHDRFGMFIHWGIYALPARHEWVKNYERISDEQYQKYFDNFNPDLYNPKEWVRKAKEAGMKYVVLTTKHHDGFCLFDSKYTDYKATNTPIGRDLVKEYVDALRTEGLKVGFYYSLLDWHHPDYTIDGFHSQRVEDEKEYAKLNKGRDMNKYREYLHNQVRELLTNYGKIDLLWLDFSYPGENGKGSKDWDSENLLKMVRSLQPGIIVNDRLDLNEYEDGWDFTTHEQYKVSKWPEVNGKKTPWETCQTFSGSWGYYRDEYTWKDSKQLLGLLIESVSKGGNLIMNVGPTARGVFDERANASLAAFGNWMKYNSRSIYGCTQAPEEFEAPAMSLLTYNPETNRLYIHLLDYPLQNLVLPNYKGKVKYAQLLHDGSEIAVSARSAEDIKENEYPNDLTLSLPVRKPNDEIPVIELILE
ncbi:alpha-L-fucosidase [Maribellus sp. YY47]|uniref:alpha-L-fucosidase n=1 Tax=Maribellus sp. YY47 TaxID=2929486 RepID=UPI002000F534|nr:alpha-L-fucosidase [Maribellus sp. YY47]MCK3685585.1 alpha-L-fucosidase [Maribellus sp. YY47]